MFSSLNLLNVGNNDPSPQKQEASFPRSETMNVGNSNPNPEGREALFLELKGNEFKK